MKRWAPPVASVAAIAAVLLFLYHPLLPVFGGPRARLMWDSVDFSWPLVAFVSRCYRHFIFPLWNPFLFSGTQFLGNLQSPMFNPPTALAALLSSMPLSHFQSLQVAQLLIGALGYHLWGRARTGSHLAGLTAAILFCGCGVVVNFFSHYTLLSLYCLLPYPFATFTLWDQTKKLCWLAATSAGLSAWMFTSYPSQLGYYCLAFAVFYLARRGRRLWSERRRLAPEWLAIAVAPAMICGIHLAPALCMIGRLERPVGLTFSQTLLGALQPAQLASLIVGGLATAPSRFETPDITLRDLSVGLTGLFLVSLALTRPRRGRLLLAAAALALIDLVLGQSSRLLPLVYWLSPLTRNSKYEMVEFGTLLSFVLLTLAIDGAGDLLADERPLSWRLGGALGAVAALWLIAWRLALNGWQPLALDGERWRSLLFAEPALSFACFALMIAAGHARKLRIPLLGLALFSAALLDSSRDLRENVSVLFEPVAPGAFRNGDRAYDRHDADYFDLTNKWPRQHVHPRPDSTATVVGVRTDWGYDSSFFPLQEQTATQPAAQAVNLNAAPFFVADRVVIAPQPETIPLLEETQHVAAFAATPLAEPLVGVDQVAVSIARYGVNAIDYSVRAKGATVVVFNEPALPGWSASVDGQPREILVANGFFRALPFPAGDHLVEFRFRPPGFQLGLSLTIAGLLLLAFALAWARRASRTRISTKRSGEQEA